MKTLDRYILRSFLTTAVLLFVALMMLRIVVDLAVNISDFTSSFSEQNVESVGQKITNIVSYYSYQSLVYFMELGGVIIVFSATFTLARMNHSNELVAMLASGVSLHRVTLPIIICSMVLGGLVIVNQEFVIPRVADKLVLKRGEAAETKEFEVHLVTDQAGTVFYARSFQGGRNAMINPLICIRDAESKLSASIFGSEATPGEHDGQKGWIFTDAQLRRVDRPGSVWPKMPDVRRVWTNLSPREMLKEAGELYFQQTGTRVTPDQIESWPEAEMTDEQYNLTIRTKQFIPQALKSGQNPSRQGGTLIEPAFTFVERGGRTLGCFLAASASWQADKDGGYWQLEGGRLFHPSDLTAETVMLRDSHDWMDYMSTSDLAKLVELERVSFRKGAEMIKHTRFTAPINNLIMLLLALPFILSRERNIKASATLCLLTVGGFYIFIYVCRYMGFNPIVAAWLPILPFGPLAVLMFDSLKT